MSRKLSDDEFTPKLPLSFISCYFILMKIFTVLLGIALVIAGCYLLA